jgi:MFS family permease
MEEKTPSNSLFRQKSFLLLFFLILNSIAWFFLITYVTIYVDPPLISFTSQLYWLFYLTALLSMLIGPVIARTLDRKRFLFVWVLLGVVSSSFLMILPSFGEYGTATLLIFWGFTFGIGLPTCFALVPSLTKIENRGRTGGLIFLATYAISPLLIATTGYLGIFSLSLMLVVWRSLALVPFLLHFDIDNAPQSKPISYRSIISRQTFLLYLLPWLAFCMVNFFEYPVLKSLGGSIADLTIVSELLIGSIFCFIGGWLIDTKGRKLGIISVLVALGFAYAFLSLSPSVSFAQMLFMVVDGIAFGILTVSFIFVVWGDMTEEGQGDKIYALGLAPIPIAVGLSTLIGGWLTGLGVGSAFTLATFFIFLAIPLILFAPELLPEKIIKKEDFKKYAEKVKKITGTG